MADRAAKTKSGGGTGYVVSLSPTRTVTLPRSSPCGAQERHAPTNGSERAAAKYLAAAAAPPAPTTQVIPSGRPNKGRRSSPRAKTSNIFFGIFFKAFPSASALSSSVSTRNFPKGKREVRRAGNSASSPSRSSQPKRISAIFVMVFYLFIF